MFPQPRGGKGIPGFGGRLCAAWGVSPAPGRGDPGPRRWEDGAGAAAAAPAPSPASRASRPGRSERPGEPRAPRRLRSADPGGDAAKGGARGAGVRASGEGRPGSQIRGPGQRGLGPPLSPQVDPLGCSRRLGGCRKASPFPPWHPSSLVGKAIGRGVPRVLWRRKGSPPCPAEAGGELARLSKAWQLRV